MKCREKACEEAEKRSAIALDTRQAYPGHGRFWYHLRASFGHIEHYLSTSPNYVAPLNWHFVLLEPSDMPRPIQSVSYDSDPAPSLPLYPEKNIPVIAWKHALPSWVDREGMIDMLDVQTHQVNGVAR